MLNQVHSDSLYLFLCLRHFYAILINELNVLSLKGIAMGYLRMDSKRGHLTCGNRLTIERQESFRKFASFKEELLLCLGLLGPNKISHGLIWGKITPAR